MILDIGNWTSDIGYQISGDDIRVWRIWPQTYLFEYQSKAVKCSGFYIPKNPVARMIQCAAIASENEVD